MQAAADRNIIQLPHCLVHLLFRDDYYARMEIRVVIQPVFRDGYCLPNTNSPDQHLL